MIGFIRNDGGRAAAGFKGSTSDCVTRAIAIASGRDYKEVYEAIRKIQKSDNGKRGGGSPRNGVHRQHYEPYILSLGFVWVPLMKIGSGTTVHVRADELPPGRLILSLSRHMAAVIDGVLHDTFDCSRAGRRAVYGYYRKVNQ